MPGAVAIGIGTEEERLAQIRLVLLQARQDVMHDLAAVRRRRPDLNRAHPARLGERDWGRRLPPYVLPAGRHGVGRRVDHQARLAELFRQLPLIDVRPLSGSRHVAGISLGRTRVDPLHDGVDLLIGEREIVLEMLDADGPVEVPGRHGARFHALLDGFRPRPRLLERNQRHGSHGSDAVTFLAVVLQDRRHILGKGHLTRRRVRLDRSLRARRRRNRGDGE